ncbi:MULTISPECIES: hypothetical protein [unclassified Streptomyces]|uniref:hypothetical protein n=1 Tax=unclassified Streptomyces TaxID=2593676 RepID=UPI00114C97FB|nr:MULTISPECIES: hypothetical protein [unclassified Streptomyces]MYS24365.1 hypothetical protein [Streptomyces sp. SID4948]
MKRVAAQLRTEAGDLRLIADGHGLKGRYADALRDGARELEVRLRETAERYERVHGGLSGWAAELAGFQAAADRILHTAQAEEKAAAGSGSGSGYGSGSGSASGAPDDGDPAGRHRKALARVTDQRDGRADHYATRIRHEIDDKIRDSWWERRKNEVDTCQSLISFVVDLMGWVASGIAIAAITMTPAGWVAGLALWLTFGVLAGHLLLASAADGSWADVGMDIFGLLTMQVGAVALTNLRKVRDATKVAAELAAEERAAETAARETRSLRDRSSAVVNRRASTRAERARARHTRNIARAASLRAGHAASAEEAAVPLAVASRWEAAVVGGDKETANLHKDVQRLREAYPDSPEVQGASLGAEAHKRAFQGMWAVATLVDGWDKGVGSSDLFPQKWQYGPYGRLKNRYTNEVGSSW